MSSKKPIIKDKLILHYTNLCATLDKELKQLSVLRGELMKEQEYDIADNIIRFEKDILVLQGRTYRELNDLTHTDKTVGSKSILRDDVD